MSGAGGSGGTSSSGGYGDSGPSHHYGMPPRPYGGPNQYQQGANASGNFNPNPSGHGSSYSRDSYPSQGHGSPSYGGRNMSCAGGSRGTSSVGGHGDSGPNYQKGGQYQHGARGQGSSYSRGRYPSHGRVPPSPPIRPGPSQPMYVSQPPIAASGLSHLIYDTPPRPYGGSNWHQQGASTSQGRSYSKDLYPSQGRGPPSYGGSDMSGAGESRGASSSGGYGDSGPNWYQPPIAAGSPNQPMHGSQPPMTAGGPSHHYNRPSRPYGVPNWYQQGASTSQGSSYNRDPYPSQGRGPPSYGGSDMSGAGGSRGASSSGSYGDSGPNYLQGGQYYSSGPGCGPGNTRNQ